MTTVVLALAVVAVSCAVNGAVGFGMNLLAVPVLALLDPVFLPGPAIAAGLLRSILIVWREPATVDRQLGWAVVGLLPGTLLAVVLLGLVPASGLAAPTGVLVLVLVLVAVAVALSAMRLDLGPSRLTLTLAGIASGPWSTGGTRGRPC